MERYDPDYDLVDVMDNAKFGSWVRYDEAQAEIARLQAEVERWKDIADATEALKQSYAEQRATARNDALEEAAVEARGCTDGCQSCAGTDHAIRALKRPTS